MHVVRSAEILFSRVYDINNVGNYGAGLSTTLEINLNRLANNMHICRNTIVGRVVVRNVDSDDGPFYFFRNVLINDILEGISPAIEFLIHQDYRFDPCRQTVTTHRGRSSQFDAGLFFVSFEVRIPDKVVLKAPLFTNFEEVRPIARSVPRRERVVILQNKEPRPALTVR